MKTITMKNMTFRTTVFLLMSVFCLACTVQADVLLIERVDAKTGVDVRQKCATMEQVRARYGDPIGQRAAVGEPPITRWEYADFIVYFEYQHVINTVMKKSKPTEIGPQSVDSFEG